MYKKIFGIFITMLLISVVFIPTSTATEVEAIGTLQSNGTTSSETFVFGYPSDEEPLTTYGIEVYDKFWDYDRDDWIYRMRLDWYQTKFTDGSMDDWPYVVLEADLTIIESGIVASSGNSFDFGGWNVEEYAPGDFSDLANLICDMVLASIPYGGIYFSTGLALAQALDEPQSYPDYEWIGEQVCEADGFFQYDCHIDPDTEFDIKFWLNIWGSSVDGGPGVHNYEIGIQYHGTSPSEPDIDLSWTPSSYDFGSVKIGEHEFKEIILENEGVSPIEVTVDFTTGSCDDFRFHSGDGTFTLDPNEEHGVVIRYEPTAKGSAYAELYVEAESQYFYCSLYGTGTRSKVKIDGINTISIDDMVYINGIMMQAENAAVGDLIVGLDGLMGLVTSIE